MSSQSEGYVFGFASGNALFPRSHLFAKFSSGILVAVGCRSRLGRDGKGRLSARVGQPLFRKMDAVLDTHWFGEVKNGPHGDRPPRSLATPLYTSLVIELFAVRDGETRLEWK